MLPPGELFAVLRQAGLTYAELLDWLADAPTTPGDLVDSRVRRRRPLP